jgi:hypothetical protein
MYNRVQVHKLDLNKSLQLMDEGDGGLTLSYLLESSTQGLSRLLRCQLTMTTVVAYPTLNGCQIVAG